jgi:DNA (cytosine-5)-methyltransferase 1
MGHPVPTSPIRGVVMNELALFAGAGGGILGAHLLGWRTVCAVEKEPYCREVLLRRQRDGMLPLFPIWDDCNTFDGNAWSGVVDIVTAGFPCQPFSVAGKQAAGGDERNGWPATLRIVSEIKPRYALLENVPGLLGARHGYFGRVLSDLASIGYDAVWDCFPAAAVGAPHLRDRLWVLGYPNSQGKPVITKHDEAPRLQGVGTNADSRGHVSQEKEKLPRGPGSVARSGWSTEPRVGRVADGVAYRVDRLKALGNGQVAPVVAFAWHQLRRKVAGYGCL